MSNPSTIIAPIEAGIEITMILFKVDIGSSIKGSLFIENKIKVTTKKSNCICQNNPKNKCSLFIFYISLENTLICKKNLENKKIKTVKHLSLKKRNCFTYIPCLF